MADSGLGTKLSAPDSGRSKRVSMCISDPSLGVGTITIRSGDACAIQIMRGNSSLDRTYFILAYRQIMSRTRLIALLTSQFTVANPPIENLFNFTRELLRHWRYQSVPGHKLRSLLRSAAACFSVSDLNALKLLAIAAAGSPPPVPRASPGLGKLLAFGQTFHGNPLAKIADELADWSLLEEFALFACVRSSELVKQAWQTPNKEKRAPNVCALVRHFNRLSHWVAAEILGQRDDDRQARVARLQVAMGVLKRALSLRAYNTAMALFAGLNHGSVQRLKRHWMMLAPEQQRFFSDTEALLSHVGNYARLAAELAAVPAGTPAMPYVGAALKDLALIHLGNATFQGKGQLNFEKIRLLGRRINDLLRYQHVRFALSWPMSSSAWAQALARADLPAEEELYHLSAMIEPKLYIPATDSAPARPFWQFSPDEVASYLAASGLAAYSPFFQKHAICGADALSLTDAELQLMGLTDPISRTKVLTALCDVAHEQHTLSRSSSSSSSSFDISSSASRSGGDSNTNTNTSNSNSKGSSSSLLVVSTAMRPPRRAPPPLRLKCECEGEIRVLRFEDGVPTDANYLVRQAAALFGIAPSDAPTLDERHLRTLLRRNGRLQIFRPHTPRETR